MADLATESLGTIAVQLDAMRGRCHPGRPAYYALSRAYEAVRSAAAEVREESRPFAGAAPQNGGGDRA